MDFLIIMFPRRDSNNLRRFKEFIYVCFGRTENRFFSFSHCLMHVSSRAFCLLHESIYFRKSFKSFRHERSHIESQQRIIKIRSAAACVKSLHTKSNFRRSGVVRTLSHSKIVLAVPSALRRCHILFT